MIQANKFEANLKNKKRIIRLISDKINSMKRKNEVNFI